MIYLHLYYDLFARYINCNLAHHHWISFQYDVYWCLQGNRVEYDQKNYKEALSDMSDIKRIEKSLQESSLLQLVEVMICFFFSLLTKHATVSVSFRD